MSAEPGRDLEGKGSVPCDPIQGGFQIRYLNFGDDLRRGLVHGDYCAKLKDIDLSREN